MLRGPPPTPAVPLNLEGIDRLQYNALQVCAVFVLYGVHVGLSVAAIPVLARREGRVWPLTAALATLLTSSTITTAIRFPMTWPVFGYYPETAITTSLMFTVLSCINYMLSDTLVVWRAWVMWPDNKFVKGLLVSCMICGTTATIFEIISQTEPVSTHIVLGFPLTLMAITLCLTNVVATTLIGIRFWIYRRDVAKLLAPNATGTSSQVGGIMLLLLESGVVYTVLWAINILVQVSEKLSGHPPDAVGPFEMMHETFYLCAGIYPTFVVVIVTLQQRKNEGSTDGQPSTFLESLHFAMDCDGRHRETYDGDMELDEPLSMSSGTSTTVYSEEIELAPRTQAAEGRKD